MPTSRLTDDMIAVVKLARSLGYMNHVIAAFYLINQGRVAEINTGQRGAGIRPAAQLPTGFPALQRAA